jgi:NAD(P)-dependent dehydrogenase (short-subunit alcohol dehydrogenase family)
MKLDVVKAKNKLASFKGCNAIVVGGTSGIGEAIAMRLAQAQFNVVIVGRNANSGKAIIERMQSLHPDGTYSFVSLDAQLLSNIKGVSSQFKQVDRLVLTQGIFTFKGRTETEEGIDRKMSLHYYSRMALIMEFLPLLRQSTRSPRVLSVLSGGTALPSSLSLIILYIT